MEIPSFVTSECRYKNVFVSVSAKTKFAAYYCDNV